MQLDSLTAEIRPRESWEAVDLGIALTRRDYWKIIRSKMLVVWPVWLVLIGLLHNHFGWLVFILLWTNVLWEKIPLYYISRTLFGGDRGMKQFLKAWPKWLMKRFFRPLFISRFAPDRSLSSPVVMLEDTKGAQLSRRLSGLRVYSGSVGVLMGMIFFLALHSMWLQMALLVYSFVPMFSFKEVSSFVFDSQPPPAEFGWVCLGCYLVAHTILTPFYAGAGFGMYLNSRTKMEGWDVELTFRRLAQRLAPVSIIVVFVSLFSFANAQQAVDSGNKSPKQAIDKVLKEDAFKIYTKTERVRKNRDASAGSGRKVTERRRLWDPSNRRAPRTGSSGAGPVNFDFSLLGWILLIVLLGCVVYLIINAIMARKRVVIEGAGKPVEKVMGMDVSQKSIPKDIVTRARELWEAGKYKECVALLYRGALSWLIYSGGVRIVESDTEFDCCNRAEGVSKSQFEYFKSLTNVWIQIAYGNKPPDSSVMNRLFDSWPFEKKESAVKARVVATGLLIVGLFLMTACNDPNYEEIEVEIGYKGKAKVFPFLAMERFLDEMSVDFRRIYSLTEMPDHSAVLIYPHSLIDEGGVTSENLLLWVEAGGSLIYVVDDLGGKFENLLEEVNKIAKKKKKEDDEHHSVLLELFGIDLITSPETYSSVKWAGETFQWQLDHDQAFSVPGYFWKNAKGYRVGSSRKSVAAIQSPYGEGMLTLVNRSNPWQNRGIGEGDHAEIFWKIINRRPNQLQEVWLLRGARASFWEMLQKYAWMPLISILLFVLFWVWNSIPRFGPIIPNAEEGSRDFQEHLLMTGSFFARKKMEYVLIEPALIRVRRRLRTFSLYEGAGNTAAEWQRLSAATGISVKSLQWALDPNPKTLSKYYTKRIQLLQQIEQKV